MRHIFWPKQERKQVGWLSEKVGDDMQEQEQRKISFQGTMKSVQSRTNVWRYRTVRAYVMNEARKGGDCI